MIPARAVSSSSSTTSSAPSRARVVVDVDVRRRQSRREVTAHAARSKGPNRRARGGVAPNLRDDVAVTFIVDRALLDDDDGGERAVWACGNVEALGRWDASATRARLEKVDRDRYACTIRCETAEEVTFKLCAVNADGEVVRWMAGEGVTFAPPRRCAKCEVRCEWPSDDARTQVSVAMVTEMSVGENKIETGGAWLAYGNREEGERSGGYGASGEGGERGDGGAAAASSVDASVDVDEDEDAEEHAENAGVEVPDSYTPGDHVAEMLGGLDTEIVYNAANEDEFGVRVAILEEGELVELWHEHGTEPGKGMRVGDIYMGTVIKVISGMQGVLVDLTGNGPPYALMQKGIEKPALAWRVEERASSGNGDGDDGDDENPQTEYAPRWSKEGGWGGLWAEEAKRTEPVGALESAGADERSYTRRLATKSASGGSTGGVWRGSGGRSQRSSRLRRRVDAARWVRWTPELDVEDELGVVAPDASTDDESNESTDDDDDDDDDVDEDENTNGGDEEEDADDAEDEQSEKERVTTAKMTRRRLREECFSMWQPGQPVVVQVTRLGSGHKGPRVTARPTLPGRNVVLCPDGDGVYVSRKLMGPARKYVKDVGQTVCPEGSALIMRTEAAGVTKETLQLDIGCLAKDWNDIVEKSEELLRASEESARAPSPRRLLQAASREQVLVRDLFGERVTKLTVDTKDSYAVIVDDLLRTGASQEIIDRVVLHEDDEPVFKALGVESVMESMIGVERIFLGPELSGAHIVVQHTEALTAIDVNAGRAAMVIGEDGEDIALRVNVAAARMVARTLRLRDIGGLVMVDLIDMHTDEARKMVESAFLEVAERDRAQVVFIPISALGVMEVARERLQTHALGKAAVIADEKGMPIPPPPEDVASRKFPTVAKKVRSVRGSRPPPWLQTGGRGRGRGRGRGGRGRGRTFRGWYEGERDDAE